MEILRIALSSLLSALVLFIIAKVIGHKQMSQLDFFDYITGITIGSISAELATELENPLRPLIAMLIYGTITIVLTKVALKFPKTRKFINGTPTILMDNGKIFRKNLKKAKLDLSEFLVMCREQGFFNISDIQTAIFEYNGKLTVLPVSTKRPLNATDMSLSPEQEFINAEVIMDGRILDENLKRMGLDTKWLEKQLELQGFKSAKDVFLAVCDRNKQLSVFVNQD